ncbi:MAG: hypothetical protein J7501_15110 [Bdellovibrio sp.]|nr:hypothetical protein [Bdellovibrio sp.]
MKRLLLLAFAMTMGLRANAASVSGDEFVSHFVAQMNRRLVYMNQDRIMERKRPYCTGLNESQIALITQIVEENPEQSSAEFLDKLAPELKCYPIFFPPAKREGWGILFNTKAYWMDIDLILATLKDLRQGHNVDTRIKLLESF